MFNDRVHKKLPVGAVKAKYEAEFYRLKERKKVLYEQNKELHIGLRYLIWSRYARCYYERVVNEETDADKITYYLKRGFLYLYPTEQNKEDIRDDVKKHKMGYYPLMEKRQTELNHQRHLLFGNKQDAYKTKDKIFRKKRYNE
jgi:hypothetical protein